MVDPSEDIDGIANRGQTKDKSKDKGEDKDKDSSHAGEESPSASSKGINPVQHSE